MRTLIGTIAALALTACSTENSSICSPVPDLAEDVGPGAIEAMARQDPAWLESRAVNCVHRWGYRLAGSDDDGATVAKAVMQACDGAVSAHASAQENIVLDFHREDSAPNVELMELGERTRTEKLAQMEREALFRVQQARAGNCKAPK